MTRSRKGRKKERREGDTRKIGNQLQGTGKQANNEVRTQQDRGGGDDLNTTKNGNEEILAWWVRLEMVGIQESPRKGKKDPENIIHPVKEL